MQLVVLMGGALGVAFLADAAGFIVGTNRKGRLKARPNFGSAPIHPGIFGVLCDVGTIFSVLALGDQSAPAPIRILGALGGLAFLFLAFVSFLVWGFTSTRT